jgi:hypothetical protein
MDMAPSKRTTSKPVAVAAVDDQRQVIALLSTPSTYGLGMGEVRRIDTHSAIVFLAGDRAYKLKRAVRYDYLDFSTLESRLRACADEVRLNRRTAPDLYLGHRPITCRPDGSLQLDGDGAVVDWVVEMARFDESAVFDQMAERGELDVSLMPALAHAVARLHAVAEWRFDHGGRRGMAWVIDGNADGFAEYGPDVLDPEACHRLTALSHEMLERQADRIMARRPQGFVRRCHGDLHLRNVCLIEGRPTLFDCIEFNDEVACIDVLYDLAFLLMDLLHRDLRVHAHVAYNEYITVTGDLDGLALLPLFLSARAAVRAKTSATAARLQSDPADQAILAKAAREYLQLGLSMIDPAPARLVTVGGLSGAGKSTLAAHLAPTLGAPPGAVVLRSDLVRKTLVGAHPLDRLGSEGYAEGVTRGVYRELAARAATATAAGRAVIVDAVFADPRDRAVIADVARTVGVPFTGLWLDAPVDTRAGRVTERRGDVSDATPAVLREQLERDVGEMTWQRLDAAPDSATVAQSAEASLVSPRTGSA